MEVEQVIEEKQQFIDKLTETKKQAGVGEKNIKSRVADSIGWEEDSQADVPLVTKRVKRFIDLFEPQKAACSAKPFIPIAQSSISQEGIDAFFEKPKKEGKKQKKLQRLEMPLQVLL